MIKQRGSVKPCTNGCGQDCRNGAKLADGTGRCSECRIKGAPVTYVCINCYHRPRTHYTGLYCLPCRKPVAGKHRVQQKRDRLTASLPGLLPCVQCQGSATMLADGPDYRICLECGHTEYEKEGD